MLPFFVFRWQTLLGLATLAASLLSLSSLGLACVALLLSGLRALLLTAALLGARVSLLAASLNSGSLSSLSLGGFICVAGAAEHSHSSHHDSERKDLFHSSNSFK